MLNDFEKRLQAFQFRIGGETYPNPLPSIELDVDNNVDLMIQQYYEQLMYNGSYYLDDPESFTDWLERGPYYSIKMPKKLNSGANRLYVSTEFRGDPLSSNGIPENFLLLIFDHFYSGFKLHLENGLVSKVEKNIMIN